MEMLSRAGTRRVANLGSKASSRRAAAICSCNVPRRHFSSTRPRRPPPQAPPTSAFVPLTSRRLISIAGVDAPSFLHGLVTSKLLNADDTPRTDGFYTGFLTAQGRVQLDAFIYPDTLRLGAAAGGDASTPADNAYLIEVDAEQVAFLMSMIKRYKLRSKFKARALQPNEGALWHIWDDDAAALSSSSDHITDQTGNKIIMEDSRAPGLGYRVITATDTELPTNTLERDHEDQYRIRRYLHGVPEGQAEILKDSLPLDANMELMGGVDFHKGCYVGQELTIRTKHRGVVRKRILPVMLYDDSAAAAPPRLEYKPGGFPGVDAEQVPAATKITQADGRRGRTASSWVRGVGNVGLAMCRLETMTDIPMPGDATVTATPTAATGSGVASEQQQQTVPSKGQSTMTFSTAEGESKTLHVKAFVPDWLRARLVDIWGATHSGGSES